MTPPVWCGVVLTKLLSRVGVSQWHFARHSFATFPGEFNTLRCKVVLSCPHMITQCYSAQAKEMKEEVLWLWIFSSHFLLALGILGGKLWSTWDLKTWKHCHNYLLALYKNVTYLLLVFFETLCVHFYSGYMSNIKGSFCLEKIWKIFKTPTPFSSLSPSHMCMKEEKKERKGKECPTHLVVAAALRVPRIHNILEESHHYHLGCCSSYLDCSSSIFFLLFTINE